MVELLFAGAPGALLPGIGTGIGRLLAAEGPAGPTIFATSNATGGLVMISVGPGGAQIVSQRFFEPAVQGAVDGRLVLLDTPEGPVIIFGSDGADSIVGYRVTPSGLGETVILTAPNLGKSSGDQGVTPIAQDFAGDIFTVDAGLLRAFSTTDPWGLEAAGSVLDTEQIALAQPTAITTAQVGNSRFVLTAGREEVGVSAFRVDGDNGPPQATASIGTNNGLGLFSVPVGLEVTEVAGRSFVVVATAPQSGSGAALSVLELTDTGALSVTDHVLDNQATRFGSVTGLSVTSHGAWSYVAVAGGDGGLSIFSLLPSGRLVHLETLVSTLEATIPAVSGVALAVAGDRLSVMLGISNSPDLIEVEADLSNQGDLFSGTASSDQLTGGALNDILDAGQGSDTVMGGAGDDILSDGSGIDVLTGGSGADLFVLSADSAPDEITDFTPGVDRLDLSAWAFLYEPTQLTVASQSWGARVTYRTETLDIYSASGATLSVEHVSAAFEQTFDRPPLVLIGSSPETQAAQSLVGSPESDTITAGEGADTVDAGENRDLVFLEGGADKFLDIPQAGLPGSDTVFGGAGDDTIAGWGGDDEFDGESGNDLIYGGNGNDTIFGGADNDAILSGPGNDSVVGDEGNDWIALENGNDFFRDSSEAGAFGRDTVFAGAGNDTIAGWGGDDRFDGEAGNDLIYGGGGRDAIYGGAGKDAILSGSGNDTVSGDDGNDWVALEDGNDFFQDSFEWESAGQDSVFGGLGNDTIAGWGGNDRFDGEAGNDLIYGGFGRDVVIGGTGRDWIDLGSGDDIYFDSEETGDNGRDTITGGTGADSFIFGDVISKDTITDFEIGIDTLELSDGLVSGRSAQEVVDDLVNVLLDGVLITFGVNETIFLQNLSSSAGLASSIVIAEDPFS